MCAPSPPSPPPAPDFAGAARAQGAANLQSTIASNVLNRPNEVTPLGSRSWSQTGNYTIPAAEGNPEVTVPLWQSKVNLTPQGQERFDQEQRIVGQLGNVAESGIERVGQAVEQPFDMSAVPARPDLPQQTAIPDQNTIGDTLYQQQTRYMDPQFADQEQALQSRLVNQGLRPGTEAYDKAARNFDMSRERAYADARDRAILASGQEQSRQFGMGAQQFGQGAQLYGLGQQGRQQGIGEQAYLRQLPLNELNALRTGSQVQMPQFQPFSTANMQPAPMFGAANAQYGAAMNNYGGQMNAYNADIANQNAMMGGLFSLGGAALGSPWLGKAAGFVR